MNPPSAVKSAARAIDVMELLAQRSHGMTLLEIARELELAKSSAHGLLGTLRNRQVVRLVQEDGRSVYRLGHRIFEIGQAYAASTDLVAEGQQVVRALSKACSETSHLAALDGNFVVYLAKHESTHPVRMVSAVGKRLPAYSTGVGKVLLAGVEDTDIERRFGAEGAMSRLTPRTISSVGELLEDLAVVRAHGYATETEQSSVGVGCVAAPVYDAAGLVASISVSLPTVRLTAATRRDLIERVLTSARALSASLGVGPYPPRIMPGMTRELG